MIIKRHISMCGHALLLQVSISCLLVMNQASTVISGCARRTRMVWLPDPWAVISVSAARWTLCVLNDKS